MNIHLDGHTLETLLVSGLSRFNTCLTFHFAHTRAGAGSLKPIKVIALMEMFNQAQ
jgi:hypothetical protein